MKAPSPIKLGAALLVGTLAVATAAIFVRYANAAAGGSSAALSLSFAGLRLSFASLLLAPAWRGLRRAGPTRHTLSLALLAGAFLAVHFAGFITSLGYTSVAASATLVNTHPLWLSVAAWAWLGQRPSRPGLLGLAVALLGGLLVALAGGGTAGSEPLLGNALALVGAAGFTGYFLLGSEAQRRGLSTRHYVVTAYSVAALTLLPLPLLAGGGYRGLPLPFYLFALLTAIIPQLIGHTAFNWSAKFISPTAVSLVALLEPLLSGLLAYLLFAEQPGALTLLGAPLLFVGVAVALREAHSPYQR